MRPAASTATRLERRRFTAWGGSAAVHAGLLALAWRGEPTRAAPPAQGAARDALPVIVELEPGGRPGGGAAAEVGVPTGTEALAGPRADLSAPRARPRLAASRRGAPPHVREAPREGAVPVLPPSLALSAAALEPEADDSAGPPPVAPSTLASEGESDEAAFAPVGTGGGEGAGSEAGSGGAGEGSGSGSGRGSGRRGEELWARVVGGGGPDLSAHVRPPYLSIREATALRTYDHFPRLPAARFRGETPFHLVVEHCVSPEGELRDVALRAGSGTSWIDDAVLAAVRTWRYRPRILEGRPVSFCHQVVIRYDRW